MKKIIILTLTALAMTSCNQDTEIAGKWELTKMTNAGTEIGVGKNKLTLTETYSKDGTWEQISLVGSDKFGSESSSAGDYKIIGDSLIINSHHSMMKATNSINPPQEIKGTVIRRYIDKLRGNTLIVTMGNIKAEYKKVNK